MLLNEKEKETIGSMAQYWREVIKRKNSSPVLEQELRQVVNMLGVKILFIVAKFAETEE